jgi:hypothetical protein
MSKKILISVGPIPAKLDSVKFVTNRFKGGLALKTAKQLSELGNDVTIVAWKFTDLETTLPIIRIEDVMDYYDKMLEVKADAYILAAAVANLMPSNPYNGKFPSHNYKVGERFNIEFEIAPRVIDEIKKKYPRSALIGYKLYDGTDEELIEAGKHTLFDSTANIVFANHPKWAKERKIVLTQDGAIFDCNFEEHVDLIHKVVNEEFYSTKIESNFKTELNDVEKRVLENYPTYEKDGRTYGTFAVRRDNSFITTTRGKNGGKEAFSEVFEVNHGTKMITASKKATLNAPLISKMLEVNQNFNIIIHGHELEGKLVHNKYEFAGSKGDLNFAKKVSVGEKILLTKHGYIVGFETIEQFNSFIGK